MRPNLLFPLGAAIVLLVSALPMLAHHSFSAQYDGENRITLEGAVTKVEWMNPHIYFYVDAENENGEVINWAIEGGPPTRLYRQGWRRDTLKNGDVITVEGSLARDGSPLVNASSVMLDGRRLFAGSSDPNDPSNN